MTRNGKLTITVDDPPGASTPAAVSPHKPVRPRSRRIRRTLVFCERWGLTGPTMLRDPMVLDEMSAGLVLSAGGGDWLLNGKRDRKVSVLN